MNTRFIIKCSLFAFLLGHIPAYAADIKACKAGGINLQSISYYTSGNEFNNIAKLSSGWIRRKMNIPVDSVPLNLDENGYPKSIEVGSQAETFISLDAWGRDLVNDIDYVLLYDGEGTLAFNLNKPQIVAQSIGRIVVKLNKGFLGLFITQTNPDNYIRNIRLIPLAIENTYNDNKFRTSYISKWSQFPVWRFMDQMNTNNSTVVNWSDRRTSSKFGGSGVALEDIVALSNQANVSPWLNIPHMASDDYVKQMASYVKANLNPKLKIYIEYSNEVWNYGFKQAQYATEQGKILGIDGLQYYADRSLQIFNIWEQVFGGSDSLVRIIGTQFYNPWVSERILSWKDLAKHTDALALGYYFGYEAGTLPDVDKTLMMSTDELMMTIKNVYLPKTKAILSQQKVIADKYALSLVAYEAGQHLSGAGTHPTLGYLPNYQPLTDKLIAANKHPMMEALYLEFYSNWTEIGGGLINWFASTGSFSKYGSWGLLENDSQNELDAPKYRAVKKINDGINQDTLDSCKIAVIRVPINIPFTGTVLPNGTFTGTLSSGELMGGTIMLNPNSPISNSGAAISGTLNK